MSIISHYKKLSLSKKIYISTAIGFSVGMFFGDLCGVLAPLNTMFILLFQTAIIPFMIFSIIQSIGCLTGERAKRVGKKGGVILICLWAVSIFYAFGLQFSFPNISRSNFFTPKTTLSGSSIDFYKMFIPSNPFASMANGYIPAIVIFCILVGMALIYEKRKESVVQSAEICASLMNRVNNYLMMLLPLGVLVMATYTFGTMSFTQIKGVLLYIFASLFYLIFISMAVYPAILTSVSDVNFNRFFHFAMPAALIAFTTGSVFLALPVIYNQMYKFNDEEKGFFPMGDTSNERGRNAISILVPLAWVVPASYKFLVIFFVIFEQWYYNSSVNFIEKIAYYIGGIPCFFGSNSVIVPFLLQVTGLPEKAYDIFMMVASFLVYFNNANGAVFIVVATIICYLSLCNRLKINYLKLVSLLALSTLCFAVFVLVLNISMTKLLSGDDKIKEELEHMNDMASIKNIVGKIDVVYLTLDQYKKDETPTPDETTLERITRTGTLRVGFDPEAIPFSFFNGNNELVGYDIDFIYDLASNFACNKIEFYTITNVLEYEKALSAGMAIDICVGGYIYAGDSMGHVIDSEPYMRCTPSVVIPISLKKEYPDFESVFESDKLTLGYRLSRSEKSIRHFIQRPLVLLNSYDDFYDKHKSKAILIPGEMASPIGIMHPGYWVYYYYGNDLKAYFAYLLPSNNKSLTFREMVNDWINTCRWDGVDKKRYDYWIMGKTNITFGTPWSVLGWLQRNHYFIGSE